MTYEVLLLRRIPISHFLKQMANGAFLAREVNPVSSEPSERRTRIRADAPIAADRGASLGVIAPDRGAPGSRALRLQGPRKMPRLSFRAAVTSSSSLSSVKSGCAIAPFPVWLQRGCCVISLGAFRQGKSLPSQTIQARLQPPAALYFCGPADMVPVRAMPHDGAGMTICGNGKAPRGLTDRPAPRRSRQQPAQCPPGDTSQGAGTRRCGGR